MASRFASSLSHDEEESCVIFRDRAGVVFFALYQEFQLRISSLDRRKDENVFQQLNGRYTRELNIRLHDIAREVISKMQPEEKQKELSHTLATIIEEFSREYQMKIRSL